MNCPNCNKEVSPDWNVCPHCGYKPVKCSDPNCDSGWLQQEAKFCPVCGEKTNSEEEMRRRKAEEEQRRRAEEARKKEEQERQKQKEEAQRSTSTKTVPSSTTSSSSSTHHSSHTSSRSSSSSNNGCGFTTISFFLACGLGGIGVAMIEDEILDIGIYCIIGAVVFGIVWIYRVFKS